MGQDRLYRAEHGLGLRRPINWRSRQVMCMCGWSHSTSRWRLSTAFFNLFLPTNGPKRTVLSSKSIAGVSLSRVDASERFLRTRWDESEAARWSLQEIDVGPDYAAAVAIEAEDWKLSRWCFDEVGWATM